MVNSKVVQGHQARKRFGQNFLSDDFYISRIVESIGAQESDHLVEIGPGLGAITEHLVTKAGKLDVVELDRDLIPRLEKKFAEHNNFTIHQSDALKFDFTQLQAQPGEKLRIVGNLPYNISTPLIFHLLRQRHVIQDMYFMLQKEVVERLCAAPATKQYGRLSVMAQYYCQAAMLFIVPPGAFSPAPKVDSAIVCLKPYKTIKNPVNDTDLLAKVVTAAFNQRRKTIRNSLKDWLSADDFETVGISPTERAERLSLDDFINICKTIENRDF
ncbi:16S rRNA (adenine(1518)-N(6)/adenine(1519)-N(6))-dimethyltransferase RsmA [Kangiella spongicola]|uniref:Ribosomal RNA small subunit methyltransferase A n=1 Tax=Kangiella spongicola TaxID=796379 RepID=A0A318D3P4_9GAMM|nr:16S rRNA (adenine(1518)-N(6)/adenine(1519)-N(6))-dimethyltransferase RsmA [Kangiella spongicola]PXF63936.1 16S rRNA (adenine(1518)-N(6)/adenine(1519)-N(6))-dimethyltransferase [Kangiella spongicola]